MSPNRFTSHSAFGPTLETESLPVLGDNRHADRARAWQRIAIALGGFWLTAGLALVAAAWL